MAILATTAVAETRKGRTGGTVRPSTNYFNPSATVDTPSLLQLQRLSALGFTPLRATLLAEMVWPDGGNRQFGGVA